MAHHSTNDLPSRLLMWQRIREYAVPPSMIDTATARRTAGDWAGACAAAGVDVDLDLRAVRNDYGADFSSRLRTDLRQLAPDLLRWHMPRIAPDGRLRPDLTVSLIHYRLQAVHLVVRTPPAWADTRQRMSLSLWEPGNGVLGRHRHPHPDRRFRLDLHRHLWDARRVHELARRCGAVPLRPDDSPWATQRWAPEAELLLRTEERHGSAFAVRRGAGRLTGFELVAPDDAHAPTLRPLPASSSRDLAALPLLPDAAARTLPDLELLRTGLVAAERLHPLVADALSIVDAPPVASGPVPGDPHQVACRGEVHRIALRDGTLTAVDHDLDQLRREQALAILGGPPLPCLQAIDTLHRSPQALPAVRERLRHGDFTGALAVVESLLGPDAVLRHGPLRETLDSAATRRIDDGLFRSGLTKQAGENVWGAIRTRTRHRPRLDRNTPRQLRSKATHRARPRTGQTI
ncbi:hypothetical protein FB566_4087 [Stackebrandtia endophytica]|uniref:Uncharacterized protein n=1 Tax=Stackebrandtia endophytica TaxID=1496996 RepID=A0A543B105_9ACTN|nr:hypothetical protein [Stackebrandtia endophytica]TQL78499.1 hypothetical protein FB566_4087 [Stackebrandtia endophytica]